MKKEITKFVKKTAKAMKKNPTASVAIGGGVLATALASTIGTVTTSIKIKKLKKELAETKKSEVTEEKPEEKKPEETEVPKEEETEEEVIEEEEVEEEEK